jgi:hypothetical protein
MGKKPGRARFLRVVATRCRPRVNARISPAQTVWPEESVLNAANMGALMLENRVDLTLFADNRYTPNVDQSSADFIVENQPIPDFVNFGSMPGISTYAYGTWGSGYTLQKNVNASTVVACETQRAARLAQDQVDIGVRLDLVLNDERREGVHGGFNASNTTAQWW